jgi:hypothetical protein
MGEGYWVMEEEKTGMNTYHRDVTIVGKNKHQHDDDYLHNDGRNSVYVSSPEGRGRGTRESDRRE